MMQNSRRSWVRGIVAIVLVGGLVLVGNGAGITPAKAQGVAPNAGVTSGWDSSLSPSKRFIILQHFNNQAVLDRNTGLVWERAPDANPATRRDWPAALPYCVNKNVGGTVGWRLPSVVELRSVQDGSLVAPYVPASVFTGVGLQQDHYWSSTTVAADPIRAWVVLFGGGEGVFPAVKSAGANLATWCVRGPMSADAY